jgi:WD40 repeat protein
MRINVGAETGTFISILVWAITCRMTSCFVCFTGGMGQGKDAAGATGNNLEACWTPDNKCLLSGGADSRVHVWSAVNGAKVATWGARHAGIPSSVRWAPGMMLAASACTEGGCALWIPTAGGGRGK